MPERGEAGKFLDLLEVCDLELDGAISALTLKLTKYKAQRDDLLAALELVEGIPLSCVHKPTIYLQCPWCGNVWANYGKIIPRHDDNCPRRAAIARVKA